MFKTSKNPEKSQKISKIHFFSKKFFFENFYLAGKKNKNIQISGGGNLSVTHERTEILVSNLGSLDGIPSRI